MKSLLYYCGYSDEPPPLDGSPAPVPPQSPEEVDDPAAATRAHTAECVRDVGDCS